MNQTGLKTTRTTVLVVLGLVALATSAVVLGWVPVPWRTQAAAAAPEPKANDLAVKLVKDIPHTLLVPIEVRDSLGIRTNGADVPCVVELLDHGQQMVLPGSTALDPNRLMRIRARFPAEVVEIGQVRDAAASEAAKQTVMRELRSGDTVAKDSVLAVFYSVDVGQKKNDLIDALVQLKLDQEILDRSEKAFRSGAIPEVFMLNARRNVEGDQNAIARAVNTLKTWNIPDADIDAVRNEAENISKRDGKRDRSKDGDWARVELRAPDSGTIIERNVAMHEMVVDNTINLFQVAKVDRLTVICNVPEDDLPKLHALKPDELQWTVTTVGADPVGVKGAIDEIGYLIDPNQHTAIVKGHIDNPGGLIRGGQFVTAAVQLRRPANVVEIPIEALIEDGAQSLVFVQPDHDKFQYTLRRVVVVQRFEHTALIRSTPVSEKEQTTKEQLALGLLPKEPLKAKEWILPRGGVELKIALQDLEAQAEKEKLDLAKN